MLSRRFSETRLSQWQMLEREVKKLLLHLTELPYSPLGGFSELVDDYHSVAVTSIYYRTSQRLSSNSGDDTILSFIFHFCASKDKQTTLKFSTAALYAFSGCLRFCVLLFREVRVFASMHIFLGNIFYVLLSVFVN